MPSGVLGMSRFHDAVTAGDIKTLKQASKKDCDQGDETGVTPTLLAASIGNGDALRTLILRGGNVDKCDFFGNTCLHFAAQKGHLHIIRILVECGANVFALDNDKQTALDIAIMSRFKAIVEYLDGTVSDKYSANSSNVRKLKEKADHDANKRIKEVVKRERSQSRSGAGVMAGKGIPGQGFNSTSSGIAQVPDTSIEGENPSMPSYFNILQTNMSLPAQQQGDLAEQVPPVGDTWLDEKDEFEEDDDDLEVLPINVFLEANKIIDLLPYLHQEKIDFESLLLITETDLENIGIQLGPRRKLLAAVEKRKKVLDAPGDIRDSAL